MFIVLSFFFLASRLPRNQMVSKGPELSPSSSFPLELKQFLLQKILKKALQDHVVLWTAPYALSQNIISSKFRHPIILDVGSIYLSIYLSIYPLLIYQSIYLSKKSTESI